MNQERVSPLREGLCVVAAALGMLSASTAHAQPSAIVVESVVSGDADAVATSLQRVVRARIEALDAAHLEATPALGFRDLALAVGCVGRTPACLEQIAGQLGVSALIWLEIERNTDGLALALVRYDIGAADTTQVDRTYRGAHADSEALDDADAVVREMFGLPPPPPRPRADVEPATGGDAALEIGLPVSLLAVGALTLAAGLAVGAVSESTRGEYVDLTVRTPADVDQALSLHDRASTEATVANALYVAGGVLMVSGLTALIIAAAASGGDDEDEAQLSAGPLVGPGTVGMYAAGRFGGGR